MQPLLTELLKPDGCRAPPRSSHRAAGALGASARTDRGEYATRAVVENLSDWIEVDKDSMSLRHALGKEFLGMRSSPFFTNSALGAQRLAEYSTVQATPPEPLKRYFRTHEIHWIASSVQPALFADRLRLVLERRFAYWDAKTSARSTMAVL